MKKLKWTQSNPKKKIWTTVLETWPKAKYPRTCKQYVATYLRTYYPSKLIIHCLCPFASLLLSMSVVFLFLLQRKDDVKSRVGGHGGEKNKCALRGGLRGSCRFLGVFFFFMDCPVPQLRIWEHRKDSKEFPRLKVIERPGPGLVPR